MMSQSTKSRGLIWTSDEFIFRFRHIQYYVITNKKNITIDGKKVRTGIFEQSIDMARSEYIRFFTINQLPQCIHANSENMMTHVRKVTILPGSTINSDGRLGCYLTNKLELSKKENIWKNTELCMYIVSRHTSFIKFVHHKIMSYELAKCIKRHGASIEFVLSNKGSKLFSTRQIYKLFKMAILQNGLVLKFANKYFNDDIIKLNKLIDMSILQNGTSIQFVDEQFMTIERCIAAITQNASSIKYISGKYISYQLCMHALQCDIKSFKHIPECFQDDDMVNYVIEKDHQLFRYVVLKLRRLPICLMIAKQCWENISEFPDVIQRDILEITLKGVPHVTSFSTMSDQFKEDNMLYKRIKY
jgi:hypothetical protein